MMNFDYKQVIAIRADLKMSAGKIAAQVAHAAVTAAEDARKKYRVWFEGWLREGQKKVVVKVKSLNELIELRFKAKENSLPWAIIEDAGLTEILAGTVTALGVGPAPSSIIDKITGKLPLL